MPAIETAKKGSDFRATIQGSELIGKQIQMSVIDIDDRSVTFSLVNKESDLLIVVPNSQVGVELWTAEMYNNFIDGSGINMNLMDAGSDSLSGGVRSKASEGESTHLPNESPVVAVMSRKEIAFVFPHTGLNPRGYVSYINLLNLEDGSMQSAQAAGKPGEAAKLSVYVKAAVGGLGISSESDIPRDWDVRA